MKNLAVPLSKEYERWRKKVGDDEPYYGDRIIGIHDVLKAHFLIADYFYKQGVGIGGIGPKNLTLLHSAVGRQLVQFDGRIKWTEPFDICATLFFGLIKNHPFHDGNKRTAFLVALYHLKKCGRVPKVVQKEFEQFTLDVASNKLSIKKHYDKFKKMGDPEVRTISTFFKANTREEDKKAYFVSYAQLNTILGRFGYKMDNPDRNYIDILREEPVPRWFGFRAPKLKEWKKIGEIGFPGWKREVGMGTIKKVRKLTNLTEKEFVDSQVFFYGEEQMENLIETYHGPLKRLADK
jgi:death-on-curing protein